MSVRNVLKFLENTEAQYGNKTAFEDKKIQFTYTELMTRAKQIGTFITEYAEMNSPVLIIMEKGPKTIAAMFGAVYAGCFYTPLDETMPDDRVKLIIETLKPNIVITQKKLLKNVQNMAGDIPVFDIDDIPTAIDEEKLRTIRLKSIDSDILYVLFTSGSTGVPKGVSITHRGVIDFAEWVVERLGINSECKYANQSPLYFDNTVLEIYSTIATGATLNFLPKKCLVYPQTIPLYLEENGINTIFWVPTMYILVANSDAFSEHIPDKLINCFFCGEVMPCKTLNYWRRYLPNAKYVNMYGPTEITDVCTYYIVDREFADDESLPIGFPCENTRIYLIDGEICVGGTGVSSGYYNSPEKTAASFVRNPLRPEIVDIIYKTGDLARYNERGELIYMGRKDFQIKKLGYRIELGEIETALLSNPNVANGCCIFDEEASKIICFYEGSIEENDLVSFLKTKLQDYMIPDEIYKKETLPTTGNGKMDRVTLKKEYKNGK